MTDTVRVPREAVEEIADDLRAISLELTKKRATTPVSEDIFHKALALEAMLAASPQEAVPTKREAALADLAKLDGETMDLAASPQGEGSSAAPIPTEQLEGAVVGAAEPIGDDGQFAYRTTIMGERHIVHVATGFVWFKLPYDYRYTDNASQRRNAETMLAALLGRPTHPAPIKPSADTGKLRERVARRICRIVRTWQGFKATPEYTLDMEVENAWDDWLSEADAILGLIQRGQP